MNSAETENNDSDSEIEYKSKAPLVESGKKMTKKGIEKKPYVLTEKRKQQFEIARIKRAENVEKRKAEKAEKNKEFLATKQKLEIKKDGREKLQQEKTLKNISYEIVKKQLEQEHEQEDIADDDNDEPQIIIKKKKPKKKVIVIESESEDDEPIIIHRSRKIPDKQNLPPRQLNPLMYF